MRWMSTQFRTWSAGKILAVCGLALMLAGCPVPAPRCTDVYYGAPGIDLRTLTPADESIEDGSVIAFGRITAPDANVQGVISARLIQFKDLLFSPAEPYAEEIIHFDPDGRFFWVLPAGHYVIQPLYFNHAYSGQSYKEKAVLNTSLRFTLPQGAKSVHLGTVNISLSSALELQSLTIAPEEETGSAKLPNWSIARDLPVSELMMIEDRVAPRQTVRHRKLCRKRRIEICVYLIYGGWCPSD